METVQVAMNNLKGNEYPEEEGSPLNKKNSDRFLVCCLEYLQLTQCLYYHLKFYLCANATGLYTYTHLGNVGLVSFVVFLVWFGLFCFV